MSTSPIAQAPASLLPVDATAQRILRQRAELLARREEQGAEGESRFYIRFLLGNEPFGVPYQFLEEILPGAQPARVPGVPPFIAGVVNRRGDLITVLDLRHLFQAAPGERRDAGVLVVTAAGVTAGIYAPHIEGNTRYDPQTLLPPPPASGVSNPAHIAGVHEGRVTLLDMEALLGDPALRIDTG